MEKALEYPFDSDYLYKKKKSIRRKLLEDNRARLKKNIAILGGSSTHDIKLILELFLLNYGIEPVFYESEYGKYWEDVMFSNEELEKFQPDLIYIHTTNRNITEFPELSYKQEDVDQLLETVYLHYETMWNKIIDTYHCPIIQNNFELPYYRLLGNRDVVDFRGHSNFINRLNKKFADFALANDGFYINDICWLSSCYGLQEWQNPFYWHMYKYAPAVPAIPELAYNISNIIKSIYGKNKKALVLDLDNTLWGGIIGDDGPENIEIGQETSVGQVYSEFQQYLKELKNLGVMLNVDSKNDEENALKGLERPDSILKPEDFIIIKANWNPKDINLLKIAEELNVGVDSLVFVDDNPAERHIVRSNVPEAAIPELGQPEHYINVLDRSGFFEVTDFSEDDLKRNEMYKANLKRVQQKAAFSDYNEYLLSLEMQAEIEPFVNIYYSRIAQLTNKSNQFNLTTKRCTLSEIEDIADNPDYVTLYGRLKDKFGDNGIVSIVFGHQLQEAFHIDLWLMSCRVLKRNMEFAMMDELIRICKSRGIKTIYGYYYPTAKNKMVKDFYSLYNFQKISENVQGDTIWKLEDIESYQIKNKVIKVVNKNEYARDIM